MGAGGVWVRGLARTTAGDRLQGTAGKNDNNYGNGTLGQIGCHQRLIRFLCARRILGKEEAM
jgi:hypothetical protein